MEMADYWVKDKTIVHKLFKVLVPRFENFPTAVTRMYKAPREYPCTDHTQRYRGRSVLELLGNPFPPVKPDQMHRNRSLIHNVLLDEAKREFYREKAKNFAETEKNVAAAEVNKEPVEKIDDLKL